MPTSAECVLVHLWNISRIRPFLSGSQTTTEQLLHAVVTSRLDIGNALLSGLTQAQLGRLQRFQNCAGRSVTRTNHRLNIIITLGLQQPHWLPVKQSIRCTLSGYRSSALSTTPPQSYRRQWIETHIPARTRRSASQGLLVMPHNLHNNPRLWNALPVGLKQSDSLAS